MTAALLPEPVRLATERAERAGFSMSCDPGTGRLLAVLAAAVPANGRVLELGTGTGAGTAWITHGLQGRADVEVVTVEIDAATAALAAQYSWPSWVRLLTGDAVEVTRGAGSFDLIFADAQGGNRLVNRTDPQHPKTKLKSQATVILLRLPDFKDEAHYGVMVVAARKARDAHRWAARLVERAVQETER